MRPRSPRRTTVQCSHTTRGTPGNAGPNPIPGRPRRALLEPHIPSPCRQHFPTGTRIIAGMKRSSRVGRVAAAAAVSAVAGIAARDALQREHTLLRNFPLIGHARYLLETIGPELRQYLVASNNEERPFTRDQRRWVYASAKKQNNYFGFGTDNIEYTPGYPVIKHRTFGRAIPPSSPAAGHEVDLPSAKQLGASRGRRKAFRPASVVNISAMSFGSLSGPAIEALNRGAALAGCLQNTGRAASPRTTATAAS